MAIVTRTDVIRAIIEGNAPMSLAEIVTTEINEWVGSERYRGMQAADEYYGNRSDVQRKKKTIENVKRSNTKLEHSIFRKLVDQKTNYLLSKKFSIASDSETYAAAINEIFDDGARRIVKAWGRSAIKSGIGWLHPSPSDGKLKFRGIPGLRAIPFWRDEEHTILDALIIFYKQDVYVGREQKKITRAEFWSATGVEYFVRTEDNGQFKIDYEKGVREDHLTLNGKPYNWERPPFVALKYNEDEWSLLRFVKELIDDVNWQTSVTADTLRDISLFIYVLRGYGGEDLATFISKLQSTLAIDVSAEGGVEKLTANVDIGAVTALLAQHRRDIYDYARSVDTQDPNLGNASGQALKFRYADLDMDANDLEQEMLAAFEVLKIYIDGYLQATGKGDFTKDTFTVTFNRDIIVNELDAITMCRDSSGVISKKTIIDNHPWVTNVDAEMVQMDKERGGVDPYPRHPVA